MAQKKSMIVLSFQIDRLDFTTPEQVCAKSWLNLAHGNNKEEQIHLQSFLFSSTGIEFILTKFKLEQDMSNLVTPEAYSTHKLFNQP